MIKKNDGYIRTSLGLATAQICHALGWHSIHQSSHDILTDTLERYLTHLTNTAAKYSQNYCRTVPNLNDVAQTFIQLGVKIPELEDYVQQVEPSPPLHVPPNKQLINGKNNLLFENDGQFPPLIESLQPVKKEEMAVEVIADVSKAEESKKSKVKHLCPNLNNQNITENFATQLSPTTMHLESPESVDFTRPGLKVTTPKGYIPTTSISTPILKSPPVKPSQAAVLHPKTASKIVVSSHQPESTKTVSALIGSSSSLKVINSPVVSPPDKTSSIKPVSLNLNGISHKKKQRASLKPVQTSAMSLKDAIVRSSPPCLTPSPHVVQSQAPTVFPMLTSPAAIVRGDAKNPITPTRKIIFPHDVKSAQLISPKVPTITKHKVNVDLKKDQVYKKPTVPNSPPYITPVSVESNFHLTDGESDLISPIPMEMPVLTMEKQIVLPETFLNVKNNVKENEIEVTSLSKEDGSFVKELSPAVFSNPDEKRKKKKKKTDKEKSDHRKEKKGKIKKKIERVEDFARIPKLTLKMGNETIMTDNASPVFVKSDVRLPSPSIPSPVNSPLTKKSKKEVKATQGFYAETITNSSTAVDVYYCPGCGRPDDGSPMIGCDSCDQWYHWPCVKITIAPADDSQWFCPKCLTCPTPAKKKKKKKKREQ